MRLSQSDNDECEAKSAQPRGPLISLSPTPVVDSSTSCLVDPWMRVLADLLDRRANGEGSDIAT